MDMLDHLFDRYGNLMAIDVQKCKNRINDPFSSEEPIAIYFQHLEDEQVINPVLAFLHVNGREVTISVKQVVEHIHWR